MAPRGKNVWSPNYSDLSWMDPITRQEVRETLAAAATQWESRTTAQQIEEGRIRWEAFRARRERREAIRRAAEERSQESQRVREEEDFFDDIMTFEPANIDQPTNIQILPVPQTVQPQTGLELVRQLNQPGRGRARGRGRVGRQQNTQNINNGGNVPRPPSFL